LTVGNGVEVSDYSLERALIPFFLQEQGLLKEFSSILGGDGEASIGSHAKLVNTYGEYTRTSRGVLAVQQRPTVLGAPSILVFGRREVEGMREIILDSSVK
jgi:hypothetical protein